tara:strand:+ start:491 stop:799 length:309 start_codon:yes stop_codon:yes gene_type:complete
MNDVEESEHRRRMLADVAAIDESIARITAAGDSYVNHYDPTLTAAQCIESLERMRDAKVRRANGEESNIQRMRRERLAKMKPGDGAALEEYRHQLEWETGQK